MTKLTGSEKQIEWAEGIRADFYKKKSTEKQESFGIVRPSTYTRLINTISAMAPGKEEEVKTKIDTVLDGMASASQWIDSRQVLNVAAAESDFMSESRAMSIIQQINKYA